MLNEAAGLCHEPSETERIRFSNDLSVLSRDLSEGAFWLTQETIAALRCIVASFQVLFEAGSQLGVSKGAALRNVIRASQSANISDLAVLARTENLARSTDKWLRLISLKLPVFSLATIPDDASFSQLIITSWPGSEAFRRLAGKLLTPNIVAISYSFEARWLSHCQRRLSQRVALTPVSATEKTAIVSGGNSRIMWPEKAKAEDPPQEPVSEGHGFDVWTYEQRLKSIRKGERGDAASGVTLAAKYVSFIGDSYAYLTRWHKVPVATKLLETSRAGTKALPERVVEDLRLGDLVVFPEGGQKAVLAQMADRLIGADAQAVRKRSKFWREALFSSGMSPEEFLMQAKNLGHSRHLVTIRNWYYDDAQIGPGERQDLDLIAVVTESDQLDTAGNDIWEAITFLRSKHLAAGSVLRDAVLNQLREVLPSVEENGSRIEVPNLGAACVVQVDAIAPSFTDESRSQVDRLLWDEY